MHKDRISVLEAKVATLDRRLGRLEDHIRRLLEAVVQDVEAGALWRAASRQNEAQACLSDGDGLAWRLENLQEQLAEARLLEAEELEVGMAIRHELPCWWGTERCSCGDVQ